MSFERPFFLFLFVLILPLVLDLIVRRKKRVKGISFLTASIPKEQRNDIKRFYFIRIILSDLFFILFTLCTVLSLSGPSWGFQLRPDMRRGLDLVLAFDISRSMNAPDSLSSSGVNNIITRLERAKELAYELCANLDNIRYAIAAGKGQGVLLIPLTYDTEAVFALLSGMDDSILTGGGTNLESLLDSASSAFRDNMNRRRGIILLTDGEVHQGALDSALNRANEAGIIVSTAGLGSNNGSPVPVEAGAAQEAYLLDPGGMQVISYRQEEVLINAAIRAGGIYIDANRNDAAATLADFYRTFASELPGEQRREPIERWQFFLFLAFICLCFSRFLVFKRKNSKSSAALIFCVFPLFFLSCSPLQGKLFIMEGNYHSSSHNYNDAISSYFKAMDYEDAFAYAEYGLGLSYSSLDENDAALERFFAVENYLEANNQAENHSELLYRVRFNTGIIHFEHGDFKNAADSFKAALEIDPGRIDAKRNLELSLLEVSRQNQNETSGQDSGSQGLSSGTAYGALMQQETQTLFDYIREKSQEQWRNEWQGETDPIWPDY